MSYAAAIANALADKCERLEREVAALRENLEILHDAMRLGGLTHTQGEGYAESPRCRIVTELLAGESPADCGSDDEVPMMKGRCFNCGLAVRIYKADQEKRPETPARGGSEP